MSEDSLVAALARAQANFTPIGKGHTNDFTFGGVSVRRGEPVPCHRKPDGSCARRVVVDRGDVVTSSACTCYLGHPDDPTADAEACAACDAAFWRDPVFIIVDDEEAS